MKLALQKIAHIYVVKSLHMYKYFQNFVCMHVSRLSVFLV